jgi:hypothetical protein
LKMKWDIGLHPRTLLRILVLSGSSCEALFHGKGLFNKFLCSTTRIAIFCTSSVQKAEEWISSNNCNDNITPERSRELLAVVDFFFSTGNTETEGILLDLRWLTAGCNPCLYEGIFCDYSNRIRSIVLRKMSSGTMCCLLLLPHS